MRETKNLKLTQFDGSDVPNWLDQYNTDMKKIDDNAGSQSTRNNAYENRFETDELKIADNRNQIDENTQDIANIKANIKEITGGSTTSVSELDTKVTNLERESDTLDSRVETLEDTCTNLETSVGNKPIGNVGANVTEAIGNVSLMDIGDSLSDAIVKVNNLTADAQQAADEVAIKVGNDDFSNVGSDISKAIGNVAIGGSLSQALKNLQDSPITANGLVYGSGTLSPEQPTVQVTFAYNLKVIELKNISKFLLITIFIPEMTGVTEVTIPTNTRFNYTGTIGSHTDLHRLIVSDRTFISGGSTIGSERAEISCIGENITFDYDLNYTRAGNVSTHTISGMFPLF